MEEHHDEDSLRPPFVGILKLDLFYSLPVPDYWDFLFPSCSQSLEVSFTPFLAISHSLLLFWKNCCELRQFDWKQLLKLLRSALPMIQAGLRSYHLSEWTGPWVLNWNSQQETLDQAQRSQNVFKTWYSKEKAVTINFCFICQIRWNDLLQDKTQDDCKYLVWKSRKNDSWKKANWKWIPQYL